MKRKIALMKHQFSIKKLAAKCAAFALLAAACPSAPAVEMEYSLQYKPVFENKNINLPALKYDGAPADMSQWKRAQKPISDDADAETVLETYTAPDGKFAIEQTVIRYKKYPFIEWKTRIKNPSNELSGLVEDIKVLSVSMKNKFTPLRSKSGMQIRYLKGANTSLYEFIENTFYLEDAESNKKFELVNSMVGLSCANFMPYFAADFTHFDGLNIAVGWPGSWKASFTHEARKVSFDVGLPKSKFRLDPGEKTSLPSILIMYRKDMPIAQAQNVWRKFILNYKTPKENGKPLITPIQAGAGGSLPTSSILKVAETIKKHKIPVDMLAVDAGWFGGYHKPTDKSTLGDWSRLGGNWNTNTFFHPNGLKPASDAARALGLKFSLWVEIERADKDAPQAKEFENLFLKFVPGNNQMLYMGTKEGWQYAFDTLCKIIDEHGVDVWRLDDNLGLFHRNLDILDAQRPDRTGLANAKQNTALLKLWDRLKKKYPKIQFDVCSAGGKRLDYESLTRAFAVWRSDSQCFPYKETGEANQIETFYLQYWLPSHSGGTGGALTDEYKQLSGISSGYHINFGIAKNDETALLAKRYCALARRVQKYIVHNFYRLTAHPENFANWCAWQGHDPEKNEGYITAFRREVSDADFLRVAPKEIDPSANYELEDKNGKKTVIKGADLQDFKIVLPRRSAALYFYKKLADK